MTRDAVRFRERIEVDKCRPPVPARNSRGLKEVVRRPGGNEVTIGLIYDKSDVMLAGELGELFQK